MNNVNIVFYVRNYQGYTSQLGESPIALSSYALPITPFKFFPDPGAAIADPDTLYATENTTSTASITGLSGNDDLGDKFGFILESEGGVTIPYSRSRIVWYFGDGTYSTELTATHSYANPGIYNVTCVFFDQSGRTYQNLLDANVTVYNFVPDQFTVTSDFFTNNEYTLTAGRIERPLNVPYSYSWQTVNSLSSVGGVVYKLTSLSGNSSFFDLKLQTNKYGHLYPYSSFYKLDTTSAATSSYVPINETTLTEPTSLYCKLTGDKLFYTSQDDAGSVFCGISGVNTLYFKNSYATDNVNLYITQYNKQLGVNILPIGLKCKVNQNNALSALAITSTGVTGEGFKTDAFKINPIKYVNQDINFVITIKDGDWYTVPLSGNFAIGNPLSNYFNLTVYPIDQNGNPVHDVGTITTNFSYLSTVSGGFFRGIFEPNQEASNIRLFARAGVYSSLTQNYLSGVSSTFSVYSTAGEYEIAKVNENFDWTQQMKNLRYQEFLTDYNVTFDDFFGSIFGNLSSDPSSSMGKVPYEKITNFVSNKCDVNTCDVDSLFSMSYELQSDFKQFEKNNFSYPARLKRLSDILSINYSRLRGNANAFNANLNNPYKLDAEKYGINLGSKLNFDTQVLTASDGYIVAYEKYSSTYKLCNTYISTVSTPLITISPPTYALSSYNSTWGWGLNLGGSLTGADILNYYDFFAYIPIRDNTILNGTIDYSSPNTTLTFTNSSYNEWVKDDGIIDSLLSNVLYTGINLLSS